MKENGKVQNSSTLRDMLIVNARGKCNKITRTLRADLFTMIFESIGQRDAITKAIKWTFCEISANNLTTDAHLVADSLKSWGVAYPGSGSIIIETLQTDANSYLDGAGEGLTIGLLEIANSSFDPKFEAKMFEAFFKGTILDSMSNSLVTSTGAGRLSNALSEFSLEVWNENLGTCNRLPMIALLIRRLKQLTVNGSALIFRDLSAQPVDKFLEYFANELISKLFLAGNFEVKAFIFLEYLKHSPHSPLSKWFQQFPELQ
jgi:hypothetical protein